MTIRTRLCTQFLPWTCLSLPGLALAASPTISAALIDRDAKARVISTIASTVTGSSPH